MQGSDNAARGWGGSAYATSTDQPRIKKKASVVFFRPAQLRSQIATRVAGSSTANPRALLVNTSP